MTGCETEGSTGEECRSEDSSHRAGSHAALDGSGDTAEVLLLAQHRSGVAIVDERPLPSVAQYDTLLNARSS